MFVVFKWDKYDGAWGHRFFKSEENAEAYAEKVRKETSSEVIVQEVQTED